MDRAFALPPGTATPDIPKGLGTGGEPWQSPCLDMDGVGHPAWWRAAGQRGLEHTLAGPVFNLTRPGRDAEPCPGGEAGDMRVPTLRISQLGMRTLQRQHRRPGRANRGGQGERGGRPGQPGL